MENLEDIQQPDEYRPAKRMRLDAPMELTEDIQEEIVDDGDWDDIYEVTAKPSPEPMSVEPTSVPELQQPTSSAELPEASATTTHHVNRLSQEDDGTPVEAIEDGNELLVPEQPLAIIDEPSTRMLEETTDVERGVSHHDDGPAVGTNSEMDTMTGVDLSGGEGAHNTSSSEEDAAPAIATTNSSGNMDLPPEPVQEPLSEPKNDSEFIAAAAAQKDSKDAEWQFDSSDAESSGSDSDSTSDDSSSNGSESGSEDGYEMLDPATAARILMSGDGDDDEGKSKANGGDHQPRTANEVKEEVIPKPNVEVTEDMKITYLGDVERTVDNLVMIKGATPGEYQVLEVGSVLCNEKRGVIGVVADTFGRVHEPLYSVAFTNTDEIEDAGMKYGARVYYVDSHSTFVFTQPLKNMKGTDASNIHDEEVGEDELEFSDDEAEQEYKRQRKAAKRGGRGALSRTAFNEERTMRTFGAPGHDSGHTFISSSDAPQQQYGGGISYDDGDAQDEFYSPLRRPDNLSQLMAGGQPPQPPPRPQQGQFDRGRGRGRGFDRGRGRGDRGRGRGGFDRRGGRGGQGHDRERRGGYAAQNGHRGNAQSFPDRHNHEPPSPPPYPQQSFQDQRNHQPPSPRQYSQQSPTQQQQMPSYQNSPPQAAGPQTYQFNGYTFQYGSGPPQPQAHSGFYGQSPQASSSATAIPPGAYVNPAFFPNQANQQFQQQWPPQQHQPAYGAAQNQQYQNAQPGAAPSPQQQNNLADILRQFGGGRQQ